MAIDYDASCDDEPEECRWCGEAVTMDDKAPYYPVTDGLTGRPASYHFECLLRSIVGSVGHQQKRCECLGGVDTSEVGLTLREAAIEAYHFYHSHQHVVR
jgi:hypothetical protein